MAGFTDRQAELLDRLLPDRTIDRIVAVANSKDVWDKSWGATVKPDPTTNKVDPKVAGDAWQAWLNGMSLSS